MGNQKNMNWLKNNGKEVVLVFLGLLLFYFIWVVPKNKLEIIDKEEIKSLVSPEIVKTKDGEIAYKYEQLLISQNALKKSSDSLSKKYKIKPKEVTVTVSKIEYVAPPFNIVSEYTDSIITLEYKDKDVHQWSVANLRDSTKNELGFTLTPDTITRVFGLKHKLFKKDELVIYEHHTNDKVKTVYAKSVGTTLPQTVAAISPYIGVNFVPLLSNKSPSIALGIAVTFPSLSIPIKRK